MGIHRCLENAQYMARDAEDVTKWTILGKYAEARADRPPEMTIDGAVQEVCQGHEEMEVATHEFDTVRSKVFIFHSIRSVLIEKVKTESSQKAEICKFKLDIGSDSNLMPVRMYKMLFM